MLFGEFADVFPPEIDGVGMVVDAYCQTFLKSREHQAIYVAPENPHYETEKEYMVEQYIGLPIPTEAYRVGLPMLDVAFHEKLRHLDFDLVHAHTPFSSGLLGAYVASKRNIPLVATFHSKYYDDFLAKTKSETIANIGVDYIVNFYNHCDEVWAVNYATADVLRSYGYEKEIIVMPNGTNLWYPTEDDIKEVEERYQLREKNVLLFVGQQNFKKNTKHIIEALALIKDDENFMMIFAGQGPDQEAMKELVKEKNLTEKVQFIGQVMDRKILSGLYAKSKAFIFPSLYEFPVFHLMQFHSQATRASPKITI